MCGVFENKALDSMFFVEYSEWIEKYGLDPGFLYSKKLHQHNLISPKFKILK